MDHLTIRYAQENDIPQILYFIKELAIYEKMPDEVVATEELLREWICLDRNKPSIDFYLSLGAKPMDEWTIYRLTGDTLRRMAEGQA